MSTLKKRSITGFIFAAVILGAIYGGEITSILLFGLVILFSSYELSRMLRRDLQDIMMLLTFLGGVVPYVLSFYYPLGDIYLYVIIGLSVLINVFLLFLLIRNKGAKTLEYLSPLTSLIYLGLPFYLLRIVLLKPPFQWELVLSIILLIWSSDTFAYLIGSQIGKNKLYPKISPGKTWEGFIGAGVSNLIVSCVLFYFLKEYSLGFFLSLGFVVWLFGSLGDLFESYLKRHIGVKDSGSFLPGHGGFLDRFDSFIFVIPFVCLLMLIFKLI